MRKRDGVERVPFTLRVEPRTCKCIKHLAVEYDTNPGQIIDIVMSHRDIVDSWIKAAAEAQRRG